MTGRDRLAEKVGHLALTLAEAGETIAALRAEIDAALAKLALARKALTPFADFARDPPFDRLPLQTVMMIGGVAARRLTVAEFLRARTALAAVEDFGLVEALPPGWFRLAGDQNGRCATDGCYGRPAYRLEADGTGSDYCVNCKARITPDAQGGKE